MSTKKPVKYPQKVFLQNFQYRFYKALDYLALFAYVVIVSVGALVADLVIVYFIQISVASSIAQYPSVSVAFDWFKIGTAFLSLFGAGIHAVFSLYSQIKLEMETAKEQLLSN